MYWEILLAWALFKAPVPRVDPYFELIQWLEGDVREVCWIRCACSGKLDVALGVMD